jgi:hypothetical protein
MKPIVYMVILASLGPVLTEARSLYYSNKKSLSRSILLFELPP